MNYFIQHKINPASLLFFVLFYLFFVTQSLAQSSPLSIQITGPTEVEVGIEYTYTITINKSTAANYRNINLTSINAKLNVNAGSSIIPGKMNGQVTSLLNISNLTSSNGGNTLSTELKLIWGDIYSNQNEELLVTCNGNYEYTTKGGSTWNYNSFQTNNEFKSISIKINRVCPPSITQNKFSFACCSNIVQYTANNYCNANTFNWSASNGAQIISGHGTSLVQVLPPLTGAYTISLEVGRSASVATYKRSFSLVVSRPAPIPISLNAIGETNPSGGPNVLCTGKSYALSVQGGTCGLNNIVWSAPGCQIAGQGTLNVTLTPLATISNNTPTVLQFSATYEGGCTPVSVNANYLIRRADAVYAPSGTLGSITAPGSTLINQIRKLTFTSNNANGSAIYIAPATLSLWQYYYYNGSQLKNYQFHTSAFVTENILVSQANGCASKSSQFSFTVPKPLVVPGNIPAPMFKRGEENVLASALEMSVYPNPVKDQIQVNFSYPSTGALVLKDHLGRECGTWEINGQTACTLQINQEQMGAGLYFLQFRNSIHTITTPISFQP